MKVSSLKSFAVASFSLFMILFSNVSLANDDQHGDQGHAATEEKKGFDANKVIFDHVLDAHEYHFLDIPGENGHSKPVTLPLPVILYSPQRGFDVFMSSKFEHGHAIHNGYKLVDGKVIAVDAAGAKDESVKVFDISLTRNVVQMLVALIVLVWIMTSVAKKYKKGIGVKKAPTGLQNAVEPVITFVRDEVAKPNLGHRYTKFLPLLLTIFFFILINNIFGLIPGSANVTGNIAFTAVLGVISFLVIIFSANKHFWSHIFNPPVPGFVKPIMVLVEFLSIFTKPFALIIRLFANMLAGHIIIICLISLIFIFGGLKAAIGWGFSPISIGFSVFIFLIEILVAFIQAFIFTNLTAVFIGQAIEETHHDGEHHDLPDDAVII
ncbi:F0F1 ATP synthase subunit A [Pseudoflavitalea sp. G-6-1-2]|uniref:F0F1 ATP synthase subunit A n=1 Tax=Pseudoflavitalea sp. G-6-1-2 TaxID=2728841 RepID=UPI00146A9109|nr:F0F1 ATP synthase subunit A [Pseudoflavitalea sp. G-6-1-2]NML20493.1 F0F1 ATP synthase subunit A [Pseudoflavitalea sp. G-6-1-2]